MPLRYSHHSRASAVRTVRKKCSVAASPALTSGAAVKPSRWRRASMSLMAGPVPTQRSVRLKPDATYDYALFRAALVALRDHRDGKDARTSRIPVADARDREERLLVRAAEGRRDQPDRRGDVAEILAVRRDHVHGGAARHVHPPFAVDRAAITIAEGQRSELALIGQ